MLLTKLHTLVVSECLVLGWINLKPRHTFECSGIWQSLTVQVMLRLYIKKFAISLHVTLNVMQFM